MKTTLSLVLLTLTSLMLAGACAKKSTPVPLLIPVAASAQDGKLNLSFLDALAERASEKQEVTIDSSTLTSLGAGLPPGPKGDAARDVLSKLRGIFVRNYEFDNDKTYSLDDINAIRKQMSAPGWVKIVSSEDKGKNGGLELSEVYMFQQTGKMGGLFILNAEPGELSIVNVVGPIDFPKLMALGGMPGIPFVPAAGLPGLPEAPRK